ncbi:hypothetical protein niasHS_010947 [Heterodera schachtii]|uniref:ZP domain-containing protein n=1 Tax=Heterodera schachtii TaxID=97005 RepID=A0ABD2J0M7_HETSC
MRTQSLKICEIGRAKVRHSPAPPNWEGIALDGVCYPSKCGGTSPPPSPRCSCGRLCASLTAKPSSSSSYRAFTVHSRFVQHIMLYKRASGVVLLPFLLSAISLINRCFRSADASSVRPSAEMGPASLCSHDSIGLLLPNPANHSATVLFAHQHFDQSICAQPFPPGAPLLRLEVPLQFLPCGVHSRRLTFPRVGLDYSLRILLHFIDGPMDVLDPIKRIFDVRCQYFPDHDQFSGRVMELSAHRSGFVVQERPLDALGGRLSQPSPSNGSQMQPECKYSIHINSEESTTVAGRVNLGDVVFHRWRCGDEYALKVYRCFVHDGRNKRHQIINDQGCSTDPSLMPHPIYSANASRAFAASRVFRFSSSTRVFFDCLLYACLKSDPQCVRTATSQCDNENAISVDLTRKRRRKRHKKEKKDELTDEERHGKVGGSSEAQLKTAFVDFTTERTVENEEETDEQKLHKALLNSQKAVKALAILNVASLATAVLLACAFCGQRKRFFSSLSISKR